MTFKARQPDYKGDGVAVWVGETKDKEPMLTIKVLNSISVKAFKNEPKEEENSQEI